MRDVRTRMTDRLAVLEREFHLGEQRLRTLENEIAVVRENLLRIAGATQVLREILTEVQAQADEAVAPVESVGEAV